MKPAKLLASTLVTGSVASLVSTAALAALAKMEGKRAAQPANSTSHWLHGENAGRVGQVDLAHTGVGLATHHASALFWALPFEAWLASHPPRSTFDLLRNASVVSAIAAIVDYGITPKRLTPGWELSLSRTSMAGGFASLALGLAAGALVSRQLRSRPRRSVIQRTGGRDMPKENDLEGRQDMGGKHGGQAGMPKPETRTAAQQGIARDRKGQEQPADKSRAQQK